MKDSNNYKLPRLPKFRELRAEAEMTCSVCGQNFDATDHDQARHHSPDPHEPYAQS